MNRCRRPVCDRACLEPLGARVSGVRQLLRLLALVLALAAGLLVIGAATSIPGYRRRRRGSWAVRHAARWVLRALGVRRTVHGAPRSGPSLVAGNHVSWLDILALAGCAPMVMVAKSEVRDWPVIGKASVRSGTIFLQRGRLRSIPLTVDEMTAALRSGSRVQVFPEGTTRCGGAMGELHRAPFQAAINAAVVVSPVAIRYVQGGLTGTTLPAFLGDESLVDSLRRVLASSGLEVTVHWLAPIPAIAGTGRDAVDRATVARLTQNAVASALGVPVVQRRPGTAPGCGTGSTSAPAPGSTVGPGRPSPGTAGRFSWRADRPVAPR